MPTPEPGGGWARPPPDEVQLETPPASIATNAISTNALRRLQRINGTSANPQANGHLDSRVSRADEVRPVAIWTVSLPTMLAGMVSPGGLKVQDEYDGSEPHCRVNAPVEPLSGVIANL